MPEPLRSISSRILDLPPSCIQFCPTQPNIFVIGTYHLHRNEPQEGHGLEEANADEATPSDESAGPPSEGQAGQKRTGSLILFRLDSDDEITQLSTQATDFAILDLAWSPHASHTDELLAVATSTGLLAFYRLSASGTDLLPSHESAITTPTTLVLSLVWHPTERSTIGVTLSDGSVRLVSSPTSWQSSSADYLQTRDLFSHTLEAWTLAFHPPHNSPAAVLSGGDDVVLACTPLDDEAAISRRWQDRKLHAAGVTAILPLSDGLVVTGSYDDHIRLVSVPAAGGRRAVRAEMDLGGGVWRLKLLEPGRGAQQSGSDGSGGLGDDDSTAATFVLLASCMHAGTRIVRLTRRGDVGGEESWGFEVLARFEEHESMNYGSDVQPRGSSSTAVPFTRTIVSTSFYDRLLCLWRVDVT